MLGVAFHFAAVAYITCFNAQKYVIDALKEEDPNYNVDANMGFCLTYAFFALANLGASTFINHFGPRTALIAGGFINIIYIAQFLYPMSFMFYIGNCISGITGALLWTAQGNFLTRNSRTETIGRNAGILWALIQSGSITGNIYMFFAVKTNEFTKRDRLLFFGFLTGMVTLAGIGMCLLKKAVYNLEPALRLRDKIRNDLKLCLKRDMILLMISFLYNGFELSFYVGVYSSALGHTDIMDEMKDTTKVALSGMLIGAGASISGIIFGILGKRTIKWGRYPIVITGCSINVINFLLISINIPDSATAVQTNDTAIITSNLPLAFGCSFALGFADACLATQIYGILGSVFASAGPATHAIFRFVQSIGSMIAFGYAKYCLYGDIAVLIVLNIASTICFCIVELRPTFKIHKLHKENTNV